MGAVRVRRGTVTDATVVGRLLFDFNTEFESPTPSAATFAARFAGLLGHDDVLLLLALDEGAGADGAPVGFALVTLRPTPYHDGPLAQLEELYVVPPVRGTGTGTLLMTSLIDLARDLEVGELHINVDEVDVDARRFYERLGFSNISPGEDYRMLLYLREL